MWQKFTERARKVVFYSQEEAQLYGEGYVAPEHLMLGLVREDDSVATRILQALGLDCETVRTAIRSCLGTENKGPSQDMTLTPAAKLVIDRAYEESRKLDNNYIGTEHLLLGLVRDEHITGQTLANLGITLEAARRETIRLQESEAKEPVGTMTSPSPNSITAIMTRAFIEAGHQSPSAIQSEHVLLALIADEGIAGKILAEAGLDRDKAKERIAELKNEAG